jgi:hypothetical protein
LLQGAVDRLDDGLRAMVVQLMSGIGHADEAGTGVM